MFFEKVSKEEWARFWNNIMPTNTLSSSNKSALEFYMSCYDKIRLPEFKGGFHEIYTPVPFTLNPGYEIIVPTGIRVAFNQKDDRVNYAVLFPMKTLAIEYKFRLINQFEIINLEYNSHIEGHIILKLENGMDLTGVPLVVKKDIRKANNALVPDMESPEYLKRVMTANIGTPILNGVFLQGIQ
jgi:dUTPase